ncbi:muramoyltetrapeptide carboxypeptidase [Herbaspirillum lusitanum]|uniref:Muramoyltetrapeptide carboxypeptidase n=1 Tax=Herbaspirillum lusitanum TaxID=213312 RepID=A0ABW9AAB2_9BURK
MSLPPETGGLSAAELQQIAALIPVGTCVAVVAPGGGAPDQANVERGVALLQAMGCTVRNFYQPEQRYQRFGATDEARVAHLHEAARDPEVDVLLALRGSYGVSRILPMIDFELLAASGKPLVGYSDITALHLALLAKTGAVSFAGPMLNGDFGGLTLNAGTLRGFWQTLTQPRSSIHSRPQLADGTPSCGDSAPDAHNPALNCSGTLWGGNLAMVTHLLGTPYFPQIEGGILFLEDVNEHPFRVERMLLQLEYAGVLQQQKAIVLGDFSGYRLAPAIDNGYDFGAMLAFLRSRLRTPLMTGLPFGHVPDLGTLAVGSHAELRSTGADGFSLEMSGYPVLR